jgi:hypothetical protein
VEVALAAGVVEVVVWTVVALALSTAVVVVVEL